MSTILKNIFPIKLICAVAKLLWDSPEPPSVQGKMLQSSPQGAIKKTVGWGTYRKAVSNWIIPTERKRTKNFKISRPFFLTSTAFVVTNACSEMFCFRKTWNNVQSCFATFLHNCEISRFARCEMKFAHVRIANISHLRSKYFTAKRFHLPERQISLKKDRSKPVVFSGGDE